MDDLKKAHNETDMILDKIEKALTEDYDVSNDKAQKVISWFFEKYEKIVEQKANELENGTITEQEYKSFLLNKVFLTKDWKKATEQLASFYVELNQKSINKINEKMAEVYAINYNAIKKAVKKEVI